jgi:hypothetical protein
MKFETLPEANRNAACSLPCSPEVSRKKRVLGVRSWQPRCCH